MSESVRAAWRSRRPEVTKPLVLDARAARKAAVDALDAFITERFGEGLVASAFQRFDHSFSPTGYAIEMGFTSRLPVPEGMRYDAKTKCIVPAKRTDAGKALAKEFNALGFTYPFIDGLGGIICGYNGTPGKRDDQARYFLGWTFQILGDDVFAVLPVEHVDDRCDLSQWEQVPLSVYYAAKEATSPDPALSAGEGAE